jgi:isocitrate dehydrogenase
VGIHKTLKQGIFTFDFHRAMTKATRVSTSEFGRAIIQQMEKEIESGI